MRYIVPILLIAMVSYFACNNTTKTKDETAIVEVPSKNPLLNKDNSNALAVKNKERITAIPVVKHHPVPQPELTPEAKKKLMAVDEKVKFADKERGKTLKRTDLVLQLFSDHDDFFYTSKDQKIAESILSYKLENENYRHYFYFDEMGSMIFYRRLEWHKNTDPPYSKETIVFWEDNEVNEVQTRSSDLTKEEGPNRLFVQEFDRPDVDKAAYKKEIMYLWDILFEEVEKNEMGISSDQ